MLTTPAPPSLARAKELDRHFTGVDPGSKGGFAILDGDGQPLLVRGLGETEEETAALLTESLNFGDIVCIEKVSGWIGPKRTKGGGAAAHGGAPGSAMFTFGYSYGLCVGVLLCSHASKLEKVTPQTWQAAVGIPKGMDYQARKRHCKMKAQGLFPDIKVTLDTADALLIAYYCYTTYMNWES